MTRLTLPEAHSLVIAVTKACSYQAYCNTYSTGEQTITAREPCERTLRYTGIRSWWLARHAGITSRAALRVLDRLARADMIVERKGWSGIRDFTLRQEEAEAVGREIIDELRNKGVPFEDEWRAENARKAQKHADELARRGVPAWVDEIALNTARQVLGPATEETLQAVARLQVEVGEVILRALVRRQQGTGFLPAPTVPTTHTGEAP